MRKDSRDWTLNSRKPAFPKASRGSAALYEAMLMATYRVGKNTYLCLSKDLVQHLLMTDSTVRSIRTPRPGETA